MSVQLVGAEDRSVDSKVTGLNRWREYAESYVLAHATEWLGGSENQSANTNASQEREKGTGPRGVFMKR